MAENLRIIFMGTPEFAVRSLQKLVEQRFHIVGVITGPDKPQGRGKKPGASPVKVYAESVGLNLLQPTNLKDPDFLSTLKDLRADLQVIVAFRMLPEVVWSMPRLGSFNLHASLLPQYRGAAPINWAIINGEKETGITTFMLKHEIDTGNVLFQEKEPIHPDDTVGTLYARLMEKGAELVVKTARAITDGDYTLTPQKEVDKVKHAPKIFREDCEIDWTQPARKIRDFIRGLSPYPAAWTTLDQKTLKIFGVTLSDEKSDKRPGQVIISDKDRLSFQTGDYLVHADELQLEGKKRMLAREFLRGYTPQQLSER